MAESAVNTRALLCVALCVALVSPGCTLLGLGPPSSRGPLRLSEVASQGDPARRASQRLVLRGLGEEARGAHGEAVYERALQVDPLNPYAYLALARLQIDSAQADRALSFLDKAEALLDPSDDDFPRVEPHLLGLRGAALRELGRPAQGRPYLARARTLAPVVWGDGHLDAAELR